MAVANVYNSFDPFASPMVTQGGCHGATEAERDLCALWVKKRAIPAHLLSDLRRDVLKARGYDDTAESCAVVEFTNWLMSVPADELGQMLQDIQEARG